ncbi:hypothetical protein ASPWEDRAFT_362867 [Aspergillus wentii DTO 134E9]|uniref:Uncharacterized protein n=1 Tax=Aspergillus wentii DTO 134E9 TaxID=1073089 RepID=A0A1L9RWA6_ASPWE|nr:uncharacterized protein ASPWEDRAFT_362867 [Aspergillus wentii DTO 134E9]KAI9929075.1 hypothetical protein MW887_001470 [Aspergillus wentii]OJJ39231.1 hypothetical protein ASPWEDRAFT_362867 [Aspergillus wentii DTO 134E9]
MFATLSPVAIQQPLHARSHYAPARSSPLAPTSTLPMFSLPQSGTYFPSFASPAQNTFPQDNAATTTSSPSLSSRSKTSPTYAQRYASTVSNPLKNNNVQRSYTTSSSPLAREKRREAFLNRVKQDRDNGRFENRGEQLMLMEHVAEQKKWGESMRKRADGIMSGFDEHLLDEEVADADAQALDEYISEEQAMEMALFENMQRDQPQSMFGQGQQRTDGSSFSDEEYDDIFMDLADPVPQDQSMDMSG